MYHKKGKHGDIIPKSNKDTYRKNLQRPKIVIEYEVILFANTHSDLNTLEDLNNHISYHDLIELISETKEGFQYTTLLYFKNVH